MATTSGVGVSEESVEDMVAVLVQGGTVFLDVSDEAAERLRERVADVEVVKDEQYSYFSIPSEDDTTGSPIHASARLERATWDETRGDSDWVRGPSPFTLRRKFEDHLEFELQVEPFYTVEGKNIAAKLVFSNISWRSNMKHNKKNKRGYFADSVDIRLTPTWQGADNVSPLHFNPSSQNPSAQHGTSDQTSLGIMSSYINPMLVGSKTWGTSSLTNEPLWRHSWSKAGDNGTATFTWKLNSWGKTLTYNVEASTKADWKKFTDVPELPPEYLNGEFIGFPDPPSVQWTVKESTFRANKLSWDVTIAVRTSCFSVKHGLIKSTKVLRSLEWHSQDLRILSDNPISLAPTGRSIGTALSQIVRETNNLWIAILLLAVLVACWELLVRDFFL